MDGDKRKQLESILENMKKENESQQQASPPRTPPPQQPPPDHRGGWGDSPKQRRHSGSGPGSMIFHPSFFYLLLQFGQISINHRLHWMVRHHRHGSKVHLHQSREFPIPDAILTQEAREKIAIHLGKFTFNFCFCQKSNVTFKKWFRNRRSRSRERDRSDRRRSRSPRRRSRSRSRERRRRSRSR